MGKVKRSKVKRSKVKRSKVKRSKVKRSKVKRSKVKRTNKVRRKTNQSKTRTRRSFVKSMSRKYRTKKASRGNRRMRGGAQQTTTAAAKPKTKLPGRKERLAMMREQTLADTTGSSVPGPYVSSLPSGLATGDAASPVMRAAGLAPGGLASDFDLQTRFRDPRSHGQSDRMGTYYADRDKEYAAQRAKVLAEEAAAKA